MLKKYPFHSFLIGLFPVIFLFAENVGQTDCADVLLPLVVMELVVGVLLLVVYLILKNWAASGIYVSMLAVWFCSYGCFYNISIGLTLNNVVLGRERWLLPIWGLLFVFGLVCLIKFHRRIPDFNKALNVVISALTGLLLLKTGMSYYILHGNGNSVHREIRSQRHHLAVNEPNDIKSMYLPSIYYIILDSYSASSVLKDEYDYDNISFISYLKENRFYVAENSHSNYAFTFLSLCSSLNLDYLNVIFDLNGRKGNDYSDIKRSIEYNSIAEYLSQRGYETVKLGSWWSPTATGKGKTWRADCIATEFNIALLKMTILRPFVEQMISPLLRHGVISVFDRIAELAQSDKPHFVFAHIICPHPPYIFGENGEEIGLLQSAAMSLQPKVSYLNQVKYINKKVEALVDTLLKDSNSPPIIVLQADHGSGYIFRPMHNRSVPDDTERDVKFLKAQFKILNAYYLPGGGGKYLYDSISPVNTFRVILNAYFGEHLDLLPDRNYYSTFVTPFSFMDATDKIKNDY
ncbi:MAG: hypothetical protein UT30_C0014G0006 [Candidatus Uhrbacteria bacterium GW2011_GWF2_39_13]|uniref:Sulfatase N-terminal domain-containing protein n=1 Tax=Candidatus Uhrbacteria bacterium GW2011_GWF2_39_13 TaxID=1618995 RepID=A0A0G0MLG8_9BACT|nr:MAG: hypothetical protein UT30_C0014G0006 [Candidatus Uhrbacteria bacterium GW2011_GWF2_39_13]